MGEPAPHVEPEVTVAHGHETSDVAVRPLLYFVAGLAASLVIVGLVVAWIFAVFLGQAERSDPPPSPLAGVEDAPTPGPLLQIAPRQDLELMMKKVNARLQAVEWVDQPRGVVRMPIERAMALAVERGFPQWPTIDPTAAAQGSNAPSSDADAASTGVQP